jgi:hypothetical protein
MSVHEPDKTTGIDSGRRLDGARQGAEAPALPALERA